MYGNNRPFSYGAPDFGRSPRSYSHFQEPPSAQKSSLFRPSAKSIFMQRKEYSESINEQPDNFQFRVEHLFTFEIDGREVRSLDDCIARLKMLDSKGRVWGQKMILEVRGGNLRLTDIENKGELESLALGSITQIKAVADSCVYDSLLTITLKERGPESKVYMFQCEEERAENIRNNLEKYARGDQGDHHWNERNLRDNLENINGQHAFGGFRKSGPPEIQPDQFGPPSNYPPLVVLAIFNHVLNDIELFVEKGSAAMPKENQEKKEKMKNKNEGDASVPSPKEFAVCLQKIKYGFNLLAKLNGVIHNPSAPDFVHILFSIVKFLASQCPRDLPSSVVVPLLFEETLQLLSKEVTPQEDQLWISLGGPWNIPRSKWPNGDQLPVYIPTFSDGWQIPPQVRTPSQNREAPGRNGQRSAFERPPLNTPEQVKSRKPMGSTPP